MAYIHKSLVAFDQMINVIFLGGHDDETISAHAARAAREGRVWGKVLCWFLDKIQPAHGKGAMEGDLRRAEIVIPIEEAALHENRDNRPSGGDSVRS